MVSDTDCQQDAACCHLYSVRYDQDVLLVLRIFETRMWLLTTNIKSVLNVHVALVKTVGQNA